MSNKHRNEYRRWLRRQANRASTSSPIRLVDGPAAPEEIGESGYYTTPGGKRVNYPNAYRRAWGKPIYHASTIRVELGRDWAIAHRIPMEVF